MISSYEYYHITEEQELMVESVREWCERNFTEEDVKEWCKNHRVPNGIYKSWTEAGFGLLGFQKKPAELPQIA